MAATREEALAWEAKQRPIAGAAGLIAGLFTLVGGLYLAIGVFADYPSVFVLDAVRDAAGQPIPGRTGLREAQVLFRDEKATEILFLAVVLAIGTLASGLVLGYLFRAVVARKPDAPKLSLIMAISGAVLVGVGGLVSQVTIVLEASDFAGLDRPDTEAARDAAAPPTAQAAETLRLIGNFALAAGFIMISLNAMRVGLLTRFLGILGIIAGVLVAIPQLSSGVPIVQCFFLIAIGALILGQWPNGVPPAWKLGEAVPWPTQQEVREQRERDLEAKRKAKAKERGEDVEEDEAEDEVPAQHGRAHSSSKKKKRKRR